MDNNQFLPKGTLLSAGSYRIEEVLGYGGFGITYLATNIHLEKKVAIKEFFPSTFCSRDDSSMRIVAMGTSGSEIISRYKEKFLKEARNIAKLRHPNIIGIHAAFEENDTAYYVMEFIEGGSLSQLVKRDGPMSVEKATGFIRQVGEALDYLHDRKMNHLDVKPANIMVREDGTAVLIDFGLSKQYDSKGNQTSTTPVGISHGYAPLEQYHPEGVKEFSRETDLYSLGATFYYLITGNVPPNASELLEGKLQFPAYISKNIQQTITKAMSPVRGKRYSSARDFINALLRNENYHSAVPNNKPKNNLTITVEKVNSLNLTERLKNLNKTTLIYAAAAIVILIILTVIFTRGKSSDGREGSLIADESTKEKAINDIIQLLPQIPYNIKTELDNKEGKDYKLIMGALLGNTYPDPYLSDFNYILTDLNQDGIPEVWIRYYYDDAGSGFSTSSGYAITVYTLRDDGQWKEAMSNDFRYLAISMVDGELYGWLDTHGIWEYHKVSMNDNQIFFTLIEEGSDFNNNERPPILDELEGNHNLTGTPITDVSLLQNY